MSSPLTRDDPAAAPPKGRPTSPPLEDERIWLDHAGLRMGELRSRPESPTFRWLGPVANHVVAFPKKPVKFQPAGRASFVVHPGTAMFMNRGDVWTRTALSTDGSSCTWFGLDPAIAHDLGADAGGVRGTDDAPLLVPMTRLTSDLVLASVAVAHAIKSDATPLGLVRERLLALLSGVLAQAHQHRPTRQIRERARALAHAVRERIAVTPEARWSLDDLARTFGVSASSLCTAFRQEFGVSIHAEQLRARLSVAVDRLTGPDTDLTSLALDLGFSSHSHFTFAFRRHFGATPSMLRARFDDGARDRRRPVPR